MSKFLKDIVKKTKNDMAAVAIDGIPGADVAGFVDTGSYLFNAMVSGSIYGGLAVNKITAIAGPEATGKTFFALSVVQNFLKTNPEGVVLYYDTEQAITTSMLDERNIPKDRIAILPVVTVEEFRFQLLQVLNDYKENKETTPMLCICDSLGMLSTKKEIEDTAEGKDTKDMTRAGLIKATFRVLTLKLGQLGIPLLLTNHTYEGMGMFATTTMSGGQGLKYSASTIIHLSKKKDRDGKDVIGVIIHCKTQKSRLTKENQMIDVQLNYTTGLNRYYGLVEIAVEAEIFKKISTKIELPDGTTRFANAINKDPKKYFTQDVLDRIEVFVKTKFCYGTSIEDAEKELEDELTNE